ncbi:MAG: hypothetical protein QF676_02660 [Dehalococcoidia bacterium]|nr:hypothetical protein [Dehalococcoidia bacterium]
MRSDTAAKLAGSYIMADPEHTNGRDVVDIATSVYESGASVVQLRDKLSGQKLITERLL